MTAPKKPRRPPTKPTYVLVRAECPVEDILTLAGFRAMRRDDYEAWLGGLEFPAVASFANDVEDVEMMFPNRGEFESCLLAVTIREEEFRVLRKLFRLRGEDGKKGGNLKRGEYVEYGLFPEPAYTPDAWMNTGVGPDPAAEDTVDYDTESEDTVDHDPPGHQSWW